LLNLKFAPFLRRRHHKNMASIKSVSRRLTWLLRYSSSRCLLTYKSRLTDHPQCPPPLQPNISGRPWRRMGEWSIAPPFLTSALDGGEWSASRPRRFTPEETALGTHCLGDWVGPTADMDVMERRKISFPYQESNPDSSAVQPATY
jgi:hypothetical protein